MLRIILGVILGSLVGFIVTGTIESAGHSLFPPPTGVNLTDPAQMKAVMSVIPAQAKVMVLLAWMLGVLAGASSANVIAARRALAGRITSGILMALAVWNMVTITHPVWLMVLIMLGALGAAALADRTFGRPRP
jgi:hypothetical protein